MITFKKRKTTEGVRLVFKEGIDNVPVQKLEQEAKREGKLHLGYHFILYKDGTCEKGIDCDNFADYTLPYYATSIYILAAGGGRLTDTQKCSLQQLLKDLNLPLKDG